MGQWKIGYPNGLDSVANENAGIALYDKWGILPITLSSKTTVVKGGQVSSVTSNSLGVSSSIFTINEFAGGFIKMRSGSKKGTVFKVVSNTTTTLTISGSMTGVSTNDYFEVITGSTTFTFPVDRNPIRRDYKWITKAASARFPYYEGGYHLPMGRELDDFVIQAFLTSESQVRELMALLNLKISYSGGDAIYDSQFAAPLILEEGENSAHRQYLVYCTDAKEIRDATKAGIREIMMHFEAVDIPSYRGI